MIEKTEEFDRKNLFCNIVACSAILSAVPVIGIEAWFAYSFFEHSFAKNFVTGVSIGVSLASLGMFGGAIYSRCRSDKESKPVEFVELKEVTIDLPDVQTSLIKNSN